MFLYMDADFWSNLNFDEIVTDFGDLAGDTSCSDDLVTLLQRCDHGSVLFGLLHLWTDQHEPKQDEDNDQWQKTGPVRSSGGCISSECGANQHGEKPFYIVFERLKRMQINRKILA